MERSWLIVGANCGRDKNGTFRCVCGRCRLMGGENVPDEIRETLEACSGIPDMKGNAPHAVAAHGVQEDAVSVVNEKSCVTVTRDGIVMGVQ